jgi:hypothetical protein
MCDVYSAPHTCCRLCNMTLCSPKRLRGSPVTEREARGPSRYPPTPTPTSFVCLVLLDGLLSRRRYAGQPRGSLPGCRDGGRPGFFFSTGPHSGSRATNKARGGTCRCCMCAHCGHGAPRTSKIVDRRKSRTWPTEVTYLTKYLLAARVAVQPVCRKSETRP